MLISLMSFLRCCAEKGDDFAQRIGMGQYRGSRVASDALE